MTGNQDKHAHVNLQGELMPSKQRGVLKKGMKKKRTKRTLADVLMAD